MDRIARAYADALFAVAKEKGILDEVREQLAQFVDALEENRDLRVFLFSPYFSSQEKRDGIARVMDGASDEFDNFLALLAEKHRLPVLFRIRTHFEELWAEENKRLGVTLTSAIELDEKIVKGVGEEIERQTDRKIDLRTNVDQEILGGLVLRVGNMVLDASLRSRLERLRTEIASG